MSEDTFNPRESRNSFYDYEKGSILSCTTAEKTALQQEMEKDGFESKMLKAEGPSTSRKVSGCKAAGFKFALRLCIKGRIGRPIADGKAERYVTTYILRCTSCVCVYVYLLRPIG